MAPKRKTKRRKNEGSVYPIRRDGTIVGWQAALKIGNRTERRNAPTEQAAEEALATLIVLRDAGIDVGSGRQTLRQWATTWLQIVQLTIRPYTYKNYLHQLTAYILPDLGEKRLDEIKVDDIQGMLTALMQRIQDASDAKRSGIHTVRKVSQRLTQMFDLAVKRNYILKSPMDGIVLPEPDPKPIYPISEAHIATLLHLALDDIDQAPIGTEQHYFALTHGWLWHVYALLGLRHGEGLGLKWEDVNWENQTISVARTITIQAERGPTPGKTKTKASTRTLPLLANQISLLQRLQTAQNTMQLRQGAKRANHGYIACGRNGRPLWAFYVNVRWHAIRDRAGIPDTATIHTMRHTVATMLDETEQCTERVKQAILGHGPKNITQHYTHARIAAMRRVLERMVDRVLNRKVG